MILVVKPTDPPAALTAGAAETIENCQLYDATPCNYKSGRSTFKFKSSIYGTATVKNALKHAQHKKCCYCEAVFDANYAGDVEHYRPKGAIGAGISRIRPGYYWLAYAWSNLYYACADCNQYRKRAAFPLANEARRARSHNDPLADEDPLLLDPGGPRDPRDHIRFNRDVPVCKSEAGRITINRLKLDREPLCTSRRKHFRLIDALCEIIRLGRDDPRADHAQAVRDARDTLLAFMRPEAEFSAASQDYLLPLRNEWDVDA